jgi:hypothetical protein
MRLLVGQHNQPIGRTRLGQPARIVVRAARHFMVN